MIYQEWYLVVYVLSAAIVGGYYILSNNCIKSTLADGFQEESFPLFVAVSIICFVVVLITTFVPFVNTVVAISLMTGFNKNTMIRL